MTGLEDLRLLRAFVRIAESGSISAAARGLNTTQPTLSRQLSQLERGAGVVLVRRDTHAMNLTDAGRALLLDARELLGLAETASQRLRAEKETPRGHLRIVAVLDFGQWMVPRLLACFRRKHPEITAELHLINRPSKFIEEGFDCGILAGGLTDTSVAARKVADLRRMLVASPALVASLGAPGKPADLKGWPWMGVLQPHFYSRDNVILMRGKERQTIRFEPALVLDSMTALREAAILGAGVTVQPEWLVGDALANGSLVRLLPEWSLPTVESHVVFTTGRHLPLRVRTFVDFAALKIPELLDAMIHPALKDGRQKAS
jgi:DNA-binding transcriptional LysR family regulator